MTKIAVITCFSYPGNSKYGFEPEYVRSDIRRVIVFAMNKVRCNPRRIIVLTDLIPDPKITRDIFRAYQDEVLDYLSKMGYRSTRNNGSYNSPYDWLDQIGKEASYRLKIPVDQLIDQIQKHVIPIIRTDSILEFASLFTIFRVVSGSRDYFSQIKQALNPIRSGDQFVFYFTGHGIRFIKGRTVDGLALVVQDLQSQVEFLRVEMIQELFDKIPSNVRGLVVFDCCHASGVLDLEYQVNNPESFTTTVYPRRGIIFLASCRSDQTCGFYEDRKAGKFGSLFTYFLINSLNKVGPSSSGGNGNVRRIINGIERDILEYRKQKGKPPQNIEVKTNVPGMDHLPEWSNSS